MTSWPVRARSCIHLLGWLILVGVVGCGAERPIKIRPQFMYDDRPLAGAAVSFIRTKGEQGRAAFGTTDEEGFAQLTTFQPYDGVLPGNYSVVVIKAPENPLTFDEIELTDETDADVLLRMSSMQEIGQQTKKRRKRKRTTIPEVYSDMAKTPLVCEVVPSSRDLVFELQADVAE